MILFEYTFIPSSEIINNIKLLEDYSIIEYIILFIILVIIFILIYYIVPIISIYLDKKEKEKEKEKKKKIISTIAIQKDINDEIEKELWII